MAIFRPNKKTGEAMGSEDFRKYGRRERQEYAIKKDVEEEKRISSNYYAVKRMSEKFRETVARQLKEAGIRKGI